MPRVTGFDHQNTRNYIPIISNEFNQPIQNTLKLLENRYIHEGRVVNQDFDDMNNINAKFGSIGFESLLNINEQIVPRFILEFYSQLHFDYNSEGHFVVSFIFQNKSFSFTLEEFGQILGIPFKGHCSYSDKWSLDYLKSCTPSNGIYKTTHPSTNDIKSLVQITQTKPITRIRPKKIIDVKENKILNHEIKSHMKSWVEIIRENVFCLGGNQDHVPACLCYMLYYITTSTRYNLAIFILKRMKAIRRQHKVNLPYGMLLTRLFKHIVSNSPELSDDRYILCDRVMYHLAPYYERKTRADHGMKRCRQLNSASSSSVFIHTSPSNHLDDKDDENEEDTSRASTPSPS
ncbi:hypothetical protein Tco_1344838 [Tanacetum coccineum]